MSLLRKCFHACFAFCLPNTLMRQTGRTVIPDHAPSSSVLGGLSTTYLYSVNVFFLLSPLPQNTDRVHLADSLRRGRVIW